MKQSIDQRSPIALVLSRPRPGVDHHSGRFIDNRQVVVLVNDVERDLLRNGPQLRARDFAQYFYLFSPLQAERRLLRFAVYRDLRLRDELLHPRPADVRNLRNQELVKALARVLRRDSIACSM